MSEKNENPLLSPEAAAPAAKQKSGKKKRRGTLGLVIRRTLLVLFTLVILAAAGLALFLNTIFTGPSETARNELALVLLEDPATQWIPGIFLDEGVIAEICSTSEG